MGVTDVVWSHQSRKITRSLEDNTVIKHLYLYLFYCHRLGLFLLTKLFLSNQLLYWYL